MSGFMDQIKCTTIENNAGKIVYYFNVDTGVDLWGLGVSEHKCSYEVQSYHQGTCMVVVVVILKSMLNHTAQGLHIE